MFRVFSTGNVSHSLHGGVVAIGNFDGIHGGHQKVLDCALKIADEQNSLALVLTFEPHPRTWFRPQSPVFRLTPAPLKARLLQEMGFDAVVEQPFDAEFSSLTAEAFVEDVLQRDMSVSHVVTGFDFHFGKGRAGTPEFLREMGEKHQFGTTLIEAYSDSEGETISSSRIRACLAAGELDEANRLLTRPYEVLGNVIKGQQLGRTLGYPTANLELPLEADLALGIYAVTVRLPSGEKFGGVSSYGRRPTFDNGPTLLESFLFDFEGDLYGQEISVSLHKRLRDERKFSSAEELVGQMNLDSSQARQYLAEHR